EELPCAIAPLVKLYEGTGLIEYETKESQTIRHADNKKPKSHLPLYNEFFPELVQIETHLEDFFLYSSLSKSKQNKQKKWQLSHEPETENELVKKQARLRHVYEIEVETCEIGVQVSKETRE
ncbi:15520_t:CDS:2, partial [Racocetra fulgida]